MAHLVRLNILVDDENEASVCDGINEMLRVAQQPVEEDGKSWIVDWALDNVRPTLTELDDSIVNETYAEGDFIRDWVAFSEAQAKCSPEDGNFGPRWPVQIPPPVATPNSPRQDRQIMTFQGRWLCERRPP